MGRRVDDSSEEETEITLQGDNLQQLQSMEGLGSTGVRLVVLGSGLPRTYPLPADGEVVVGRSDTAGVRIDEDSISRKHAILRIGENLTLEDLGSLNGTKVRDRALKKGDIAELIPGEAFELGKVMCIVQRRTSTTARRRALRPHGYIEARLDEEVERRPHDAGGLALARFHVEGHLAKGVVEAAVERALAPGDLVGEYGPGELEVLFLDATWEQVEQRCERFVLELKSSAKRVSTGIALFPQDGQTSAALFGAANDKLVGKKGDDDDEGSRPVPRGAMERLKKLVDRVAKSEISIVLHGETGVGKEVMARELHRASHRADKPFVGLNCAALTETLLETELFGHERGAFSGAVASKPGLFETADEGTVFLDEVGEMSLAMQAKLLRVIEERQVLRVGGLQPRPIDVRFIAASHRDLEDEVARGRFRQDLYFRLNGITLEIPPLRERTDEIEGLARAFLLEACRKAKRLDTPRLSKEAVELLKGYAWPGNVRELRNVVERAVILCTGSAITPEHLPVEKMLAHKRTPKPALAAPSQPRPPSPQRERERERPPPMRPVDDLHAPTSEMPRLPRQQSGWDDSPATMPALPAATPSSLKDAVEEVERERILEALRLCAGNQTKAAALLGISRRTLLNRLDQYGLPRPRK